MIAQTNQICTYDPSVSIVFRKTRERFGGLSNMAAGFPLKVNGIRIRTSEALYQACRFPHKSDVQRRIIDARSPMTAKMRGKPFRKESRPDWDAVRVPIMRWCLRVKLAENWRNFGALLLETGNRPIVEQSLRDDFWGAKVSDDGSLVGMNVLGRLLMELREQFRANTSERLRIVEPVSIPEFLLLRKPIDTIYIGEGIGSYSEAETRPTPTIEVLTSPEPFQQSLFNRPVVSQAQTESQNILTTENVRRVMPEPYPSYRDSGIPWLDLIPEHWETKRAKRLFQKMERSVTESDEVVTCFRDGIVTLRKNRRISGFTESLKEIGYQGIRRGDLVIHGMDAFAGAIGVADSDGKGTPVYSVCKPGPTANAQYYAYTLREMARSRWIQALAKGIRERSTDFRFERFGPQQLPRPPLPEQAAIVRYLDHVDRRIQRYIRAKQKLIALLEEQKQAVIHQAVTGQIDVRTGQPYPAYKDSGVEWLGKVPERWEVVPLSRALTQRKEKNDPIKTTDILSLSLDTGVIPYAEKKAGGNKAKEDLSAYMLAYPGDIVVNSMNVVVGSVGLSKYFGAVSPVYYMLRPRREDDLVEYFDAIFQDVGFQRSLFGLGNGIMYIESRSSGKLNTIRLRIPMTRLKKVVLPYPAPGEQAAIVKYLDEATLDTEIAVARTNREIDLLREYRTRLIADLVTGKLDVREAAARLPDEIKEPQPLDEVEALIDGEGESAADLDGSPEEAPVS